MKNQDKEHSKFLDFKEAISNFKKTLSFDNKSNKDANLSPKKPKKSMKIFDQIEPKAQNEKPSVLVKVTQQIQVATLQEKEFFYKLKVPEKETVIQTYLNSNTTLILKSQNNFVSETKSKSKKQIILQSKSQIVSKRRISILKDKSVSKNNDLVRRRVSFSSMDKVIKVDNWKNLNAIEPERTLKFKNSEAELCLIF